MGYLVHILLGVIAQAFGEVDVWSAGWRPPGILVAALVLLAVPHIAAGAARRAALAGRFKWATFWARAVHASPPLLFFGLVLTGWVRLVREWTAAELSLFSWPEPALLLSLAPFALYELVAIDAHTRAHELGPGGRRRARNFQWRMFLSGLLPLVVYVLIAALVGAPRVLRAHIEHVALWNAVFMGALGLLLIMLLPVLLKNICETRPLSAGPRREVLDAVGRRAGFHARELLVWHTGNTMANAAIVGLLPRRRAVLFSDSLLTMLSLRELAAVYGHEIGHAVRHHVAIFLAFAVAFSLGGDLVVTGLLAAFEAPVWAPGLLITVLFGTWYLSFGWLSRRFELEADLFSIDLLGDHLAMIGALERVGGRLRDVAGWRHFSTRDRVAFIQRAAFDPAFVQRFRRRLTWFARLGFALAALAVVVQAVLLSRSYREERVFVDLSLGRYAAASERVAGSSNAELVALVEEGAALAETGRSGVPDLCQAAEAAVNAGELERAFGLLELGLLRGARGLRPALELLEDVLERGEPSGPGQPREPRDMDWVPAWRAQLRAAPDLHPAAPEFYPAAPVPQ